MCFDSFCVVAYSDKGEILKNKIVEVLKTDFFADDVFVTENRKENDEIIKTAFEKSHSGKRTLLVFVAAMGICVRKISPFLESKLTDAAVLCVDDCGKFVISVLSGHVGGANNACVKLALALGAESVVTTSTDNNEKWAVDVWLTTTFGFDLKSDFDERMRGVKMTFSLDDEQVSKKEKIKRISAFIRDVNSRSLSGERLFHVGIGCKKDTEPQKLFEFVRCVFEEKKLPFELIRSVSSIDLKKDESAILAFAENVGVNAEFFSAEKLNTIEESYPKMRFSKSEFVQSVAKVDCVCERSSFLSAIQGEFSDHIILVSKVAKDGMTVAVSL